MDLLNTFSKGLIFWDIYEDVFGYSLEKLNFYWQQSKEFEEEFYYLVLEKLYSRSQKDGNEKEKFDKLLNELDLPDEIYSAWKTFDYNWLLKEFEAIEKNKTETWTWDSQKKWKQFENFLKNLFNSIDWLEEIKIEQAEDEQIDLVLKNNINKPFWYSLKSPLIIWEAKNWSAKTWTEVINTVRWKNDWHKNFSRIWLVIAMNWFTKTVDWNLLRDWAWDRIMVAITWEDIKELLNKKLNPIEWLEWIIVKSFV